MNDTYFKVTREGGVSIYDENFVYRIGIVVHPNPDRKSGAACGEGLHLFKSFIKAENTYVPGGVREIYVVHAGVILGEDYEKVRCASCDVLKLLNEQELEAYRKEDEKERKRIKREEDRLRKLAEYRTKIGVGQGVEPLCGRQWIEDNIGKVTQEDIDNCTLEVSVSGKRVLHINSKVKVSKREVRQIMKDRSERVVVA